MSASARVFRSAGIVVAGIVAVLAGAGRLHAQATHWTGDVSPNWSDSGNWSSACRRRATSRSNSTRPQLAVVARQRHQRRALQTVRLGSTSGGWRLQRYGQLPDPPGQLRWLRDHRLRQQHLGAEHDAARTPRPSAATTRAPRSRSAARSPPMSAVTIKGAGNVAFTQMVSEQWRTSP